MDEVFIVQKRPTSEKSPNGYYYKIIDTRTGEPSAPSFLDETRAEQRCKHLNSELSFAPAIVPTLFTE